MPGSQMLNTYGDVLRPDDEEEKCENAVSNDSTIFQEEAATSSKPTQSKARIILTMSAIYVAIFLAALDTVILPTALPTITVALKTSDTGFAWIGATHMLSGATSIAFWGRISDIFGRKTVLLSAKALFMVGSLISALCDGIGMLFLGRIFQGMGGAGVVILGNRVIDDLFDSHHRTFYLTLSGLAWSTAMAVAPLLGGAIADTIGWRWCFWINIPSTAITFVLLFFLHVHHPRVPLSDGLKAVDWLGPLTIITGTVLCLLGVEMGGVQFRWDSAPILSFIIVGLFTLLLFIFIEWKIASQPLFPLRMFKNRSVSAAYAICATHGMAYQSHLYFMPCYFQAVLGASPTTSGLWSLIMTGVMAVTNIATGFYLKKRGNHNLVIRVGTALLTLGLGLFIEFPAHRDWTRLVPYQIILALGLGMLFQPPLIAMQKHLPQEDAGHGTSAFLFLRPLSYGISAVVGQLLLQSQLKTKYNQMVEVGVPSRIAETLAYEDTVKGTPLIPMLSEEQQDVVRSALTHALDKIWIFYTAIALVALVAAFCIREEGTEERHGRSGEERKEGT